MSTVLSLVKESESGQAADTGSAIHMAAASFHQEAKGDVPTALRIMRETVQKYPFADLDAAETQFRRYAADKRNREAVVVLCEAKVEIEIEAAKDDPTQEKVVILGTLDQVREESGRLCVWDIKTGSMFKGPEMINAHVFQLAAYQFGASTRLGKPVHSAGLIRTKDYLDSRPGPVFWPMPWYYRDLHHFLAAIASRVAKVRRGEIEFSPSGDHCKWCPARGVGNCVPLLTELKNAA